MILPSFFSSVYHQDKDVNRLHKYGEQLHTHTHRAEQRVGHWRKTTEGEKVRVTGTAHSDVQNMYL